MQEESEKKHHNCKPISNGKVIRASYYEGPDGGVEQDLLTGKGYQKSLLTTGEERRNKPLQDLVFPTKGPEKY